MSEQRVVRIAVFGARGYRGTEARPITCFPWDRISSSINPSDYDVLVINLLSLQDQSTVDWRAFLEVMNLQSTMQVIDNQGAIIVLGDPRFRVQYSPPPRYDIPNSAVAEADFLAWTGLIFNWDGRPGTSIEFNAEYWSQYARYLRNLRRWNYSLRGCEPDNNSFSQVFNVETLRRSSVEVNVSPVTICANRYGGGLAFEIRLSLVRRSPTAASEILQEFGPLIFLPKVDLDNQEALEIILTDLCGVDLTPREPEWLASVVAPGQASIDGEIASIEDEIQSLVGRLDARYAEREASRRFLQLLYAREEKLEPAARDVLRALGGDVEEPQESNKEDGWVVVRLPDRTLEGVLEIKSTRNPQLGEGAIRQLREWRDRGIDMRQKVYKGILVASNAVNAPVWERPDAFSGSFRNSLRLGSFVAVKAEDLYILYVLKARGRLDIDEFWGRLFDTNGVFDIAPYRVLLEPGEFPQC